jgi:hypothetical protein
MHEFDMVIFTRPCDFYKFEEGKPNPSRLYQLHIDLIIKHLIDESEYGNPFTWMEVLGHHNFDKKLFETCHILQNDIDFKNYTKYSFDFPFINSSYSELIE